MIDIHAHIIPDVDDGSNSLQSSIELIRKAIEFGVTDIICTPHYRKFMFETSIDEIKLSFLNLQREVEKNKLNIKLHLGQEIYCNSDLEFRKNLSMLDEKLISSMVDSKYILLEFSYTRDIDIVEIVCMAKNKGYIPIIAHVERYIYANSISKVLKLIDYGAKIQVNASSIIGEDGRKVKKFVNKLISLGLVDFVASDIHESRTNYLEDAYKRVIKKHGLEMAEKIFKTNALEIIGLNK